MMIDRYSINIVSILVLFICFGTSKGAVHTDNFNTGSTQAGYWAGISNGTVRGLGEPGFNGSHALWFGGDGTRSAVTKDFNTSYGASLSFRFRAGNYSSAIWEGSDPGEAFVLEVSTNGGGSWFSLRNFAMWDRSLYGYWRQFTVQLPALAQSTTTRFRFRQVAHSNAGWDHWAIDDVEVTTVDPVGTSWSQSLGENFNIKYVRCDTGGTVQMLVEGTGAFTLGGFSGNVGTYLASAGANGVWTKLTQLSTAKTNSGFTVYDMDTDASGNVYICGLYQGVTPLGLPAPSGSNAFVAKLSSAHVLQWAKPAWGGGFFYGLSVDGSGNVVVVGPYGTWMRFGPNGYIGEPQLDGESGAQFIAKYNSSGAYQWSRRIGDDISSDPQFLAGVRCDSAGNSYVWGRFYNQLSISPLSDLVKPAGYSGTQFGFVVKYNSSGAPQWSTTMGESSETYDLAVSGSDVYVTGTYGHGGNPFKPLGSLVSEVGDANVSSDDWFVLKMNSNSSVSWVKTAGAVTGQAGSVTGLRYKDALRVDTGGNIYTIFRNHGNDTLLGGTDTIEAYPGFSAILSKWTSSGVLTWYKRAALGSASMDLDPIGQTYVAGHSGQLGVFESNAALNRQFLHKFNNILEDTSPVAVTIERETIPANWVSGRDLGLLRTVDADGAGTYTLELVTGDGDGHNAFFEIGNDKHLRLASGARLAEGDEISCRIRVTDEEGGEAESIIEFDTIAPDTGQWVDTFTFDSGSLRASAAGPDGSCYVGGDFTGTLTAGDKTVTSQGTGSDWFLVKHDPDGEVAWVLHGGGQSNDYFGAIDVGNDGRIHVALRLTNAAGNITILRNGGSSGAISGFSAAGTHGGYFDMAVASFNPDGNMRWYNMVDGGTNAEYPQGIGYDVTSGRVVLTGSFYEQIYTSGYTLRNQFQTGGVLSGLTAGPVLTAPAGGSTDSEAFILSYDSTGAVEWAKQAGSNLTSYSTDSGEDAVFDSEGNVVVVGQFSGNANFAGTSKVSGGTGTPYPNSDIFLWKLASNGNPIWLRTGGNSDQTDQGSKLGVDASDNIYMVGRIFGNAFGGDSASFGSVSFVPTEHFDVVVVKYSSTGTALRGHQFGDNTSAYSTANEVRGFKVWANGEFSIDAPASQVDGVNILDESSQAQIGIQHHFAADGTKTWTGTDYFSQFTGFAPDLAPLITREASANEEVIGVILTAGPFVARINGPSPVRAAPTGITLSSPTPSASSLFSPAALSVPDVAISSSAAVSVDENEPAGTVVAEIAAVDTDSADFTFQLIGGIGSDGNPAFAVANGNLVTTGPLNYEEIPSYSVRLRVIDESGLTFEEAFTIGVNDLPDTVTPTFTFSNTQHQADGQPHGVAVSVVPYGVPFDLTYNGGASEPSAVGPHSVVASPSHPDYAGDGITTMWIRDPYLQWIASQLASQIANDPTKENTGWGRLADPDEDHLNNWLEYYFGTQAGVMDLQQSALSPVLGSGNVSFEWLRNPTGPDGVVKWSPNLLDWYSSGEGPSGDVRNITEQVLGVESGRQRVRATVPTGQSKSGFIRVEVPQGTP